MSGAVVAHGSTLAQTFVEAVLGLFSRAVDPVQVEPREIREVRAHGDSPEALLAHWIAECYYVHELEGFVFHSIELARFDVETRSGAEPMRLYAFLHGEALDPIRHRVVSPVKPVALARITIRSDREGYEIRLGP
ncbi:MAG TPA: archease [Candidatus Methylomirabilis sp.]|nr:archease [Candidatus Methylomirabilis sp.]